MKKRSNYSFWILDVLGNLRLEAIAIALRLEAIAIRLEAIALGLEAMEAIAIRLEAIALGLEAMEAIAIRSEAIALSIAIRMEAIAIRLEAIADRLEANAPCFCVGVLGNRRHVKKDSLTWLKVPSNAESQTTANAPFPMNPADIDAQSAETGKLSSPISRGWVLSPLGDAYMVQTCESLPGLTQKESRT